MSPPASVHDLVQAHRITAVIYGRRSSISPKPSATRRNRRLNSPGWSPLTKAHCEGCLLA